MKCRFEHDEDCCNSDSPQYMCKCKPSVCHSAVPMTNADRIRAMSDQELAAFLDRISIGGDETWECIFKTTFCDCCPTVEVTEEDGTQHHLNECDFADGVCPHGNSIQWWLKQPVAKE